MTNEQVVDPAVSRQKFDRELKQFRDLAPQYRKRGIWLLESHFPEVRLAFAAINMRPLCVPFGACLDFSNYDLLPPSLTLVDPVSDTPLQKSQVSMPRKVVTRTPQSSQATGTTTMCEVVSVLDMLQAYQATDSPFLCMPGIREYHTHPAHTGDSWLLHRRRGEGTLAHIVEQLAKYGSEPVKEYACQVQIKEVKVVGCHVRQEAAPE